MTNTAILFPVFAQARENARKAKSVSNLKQQIGAVQSNPNVPPQVKQWLEYNARQQQAPAANYGR